MALEVSDLFSKRRFAIAAVLAVGVEATLAHLSGLSLNDTGALNIGSILVLFIVFYALIWVIERIFGWGRSRR